MSNSQVRVGQNRALAVTLGVLVALAAVIGLVSVVWTDWAWFSSIGFSQVFRTLLGTRVALFVVFGLIMGLSVAATILTAYKLRPRVRMATPSSAALGRYRDYLDVRRLAAVAIPSIALGILGGLSAVGEADVFLAWRHATPFGTTDPYFGKDVSFYVFDYPWWRFLLGYAMATTIVCAVVALLVHLSLGALQAVATQRRVLVEGQSIQMRRPTLDPAAQAHLSVLLGVVLVCYGLDALLDRNGFSVSANSLFTGIGYTDEHARINAKLVVAVISFICALLFFANAKLRIWRLPMAAFVLMLVSSLILAGIYPAVVQQFDVKPDEPDKQRPYIANNITATRAAYGIDRVEISDYSAQTTVSAGQLKADAEALPGIRLMDPAVIAPAFEQLQQVRGYYSFPAVVDVDRYTIDGKFTDAVVAAREIDLTGVPDKSWNNIHTVYTHGYGMVAAYGNKREANGEPSWIAGDIPIQGALEEHEPRIYFGEQTKDYAIVGAPEGAEPVELDTPGGGDNGVEQKFTYTGSGGVAIGNPVVRALFAARFMDVNLLLSGRVNSASRILFDRTPAERVSKVAPWLTVDSDPYPAVIDGRLVWLLDGYTTTARYPNSQFVDWRDATSDSNVQQQAYLQQNVNYVRNAVKAVVDAYTGKVDLYAWDEADPILRTWMKVYPGSVQPKSAISADLLAHMRYPQDLFKVQRQVLGRYHTIDPSTWYQQSDLWEVPDDPVKSGTMQEPPYYLSIKWPGDDSAVFSQTAVFVPNKRQNLGAYLAVVADASSPDYGRMRVLKLSNSQQIAGPGQTFNAINTNEVVSQRLRPFLNQGSAAAIYGNLLTIPVGDGLLYVQPIYSQRSGSTAGYPALAFVAVRFGEHVGIGDTLQEALDQVFQGNSGADTGEEPTTPTTPSTATGEELAAELLAAAQVDFLAADAALQAGDLATYQAKITTARTKVTQANEALGR